MGEPAEELALIQGTIHSACMACANILSGLAGQLQKLEEQKHAALAREEYAVTHRIKVKACLCTVCDGCSGGD